MESIIKIKNLQQWFFSELEHSYEQGECAAIFKRLLEHHDISSIDRILNPAIVYDKALWQSYVTRLKLQEPIQYILGYEYFAENKYAVNEQVLIPRPETEELVNWIAKENNAVSGLEIIEIGTGSGCIAISLNKILPDTKIAATDISAEALDVAKNNAEQLGAEITFLKDDILNTQLSEKKYDIIVSNPPYIPVDEAAEIDKRVKEYEPHLALFTEEKKPLQFYEAIIKFAVGSLNSNGLIYFEMHEDYATEVFELAQEYNMIPEIKEDIYRKERMIKIKKGNA